MIFIIYKKKHLIGKRTGRVTWPFIFVSARTRSLERTMVHELIHWAQIKELWVIKFYFMYWKFHRKYGYRHNPFELEAYHNAHNREYLETRPKFAWKQYE